MSKNQGITVVQLAIIIVVMLIIISISVFESPDITRKADTTKMYVEITTIQDAVNEREALNEIKISGDVMIIGDNNYNVEIALSEGENIDGTGDTKLYGNLDFTSNREVGRIFEIENIENDYVICADDLTIYLEEGYTLPDGSIAFTANEFQNYFENSFVK